MLKWFDKIITGADTADVSGYAIVGDGGIAESFPIPEEFNKEIGELLSRINELEKDKLRLDWLSDKDNHIGNVQLPKECVLRNMDSMRGAIDDAMEVR